MSDIAPISSGPIGVVAPSRDTEGRAPDRAAPAAPERADDRVEVSEVALYLSKLRDLPVRQDLIDMARERIASGEYDSPEAIDAAIDGLIEDIAG